MLYGQKGNCNDKRYVNKLFYRTLLVTSVLIGQSFVTARKQHDITEIDVSFVIVLTLY